MTRSRCRTTNSVFILNDSGLLIPGPSSAGCTCFAILHSKKNLDLEDGASYCINIQQVALPCRLTDLL